MDTLKNIATDYTNFYAYTDEVSVITGDGAKRFAEAVKEDMCAEMNIKFLTIDTDKCDFANDEKASRDVVRTLQCLAQENNMLSTKSKSGCKDTLAWLSIKRQRP